MTGKDTKIEPDPPTDGLLVLNLQITGISAGPLSGADDLTFTASSLQVLHRPRVNGVLQSPQTYTVATGATPLYLYSPEAPRFSFAGEYWLPPGQVQEVRVTVDEAAGSFGQSSKAITFGTSGSGNTSGTVVFTATSPKPEIIAATATGALARVPAGASGAFTAVSSTIVRMNPERELESIPKPERFPFDSDELIVWFHPSASQQQITTLLSSSGGTVVYSRQSGLNIVRFAGEEWGGTVARLMLYRASSLVSLATLNPRLHQTAHDPDIFDDPYYVDNEAAFLADIGVEAAWASQTGSRDVIIGMLDSGLDINHPDLVNALWVNEGELPEVCGGPFVDTFDLDGDGYFTLNDLNNPASGSALTDALADLADCEAITLSHTLYNRSETTADDGVYQGGDLIAAFADSVDDDSSGIVDDFFGANFTDAVSGCEGAVAPTSDVYPDELESNHGTQMAGLIGAQQDNARNTAGVMGSVRIISARVDEADEACEDTTVNGMMGEALSALDYLHAMGAQIILYEKAADLQEAEDYWIDTMGKLDLEFEDKPETLFVVGMGNWLRDCDNPTIGCFPGESSASNAISVAGTGWDNTYWDTPSFTGEVNGLWVAAGAHGTSPGSGFGELSADIGAPAEIDFDGAGGAIAYVNTIQLGLPTGSFYAWAPEAPGATGGTSAAIALTGGVAALILSECPATASDGAALRSLVLDGARTESVLSGSVASSRFLDAEGGLSQCP